MPCSLWCTGRDLWAGLPGFCFGSCGQGFSFQLPSSLVSFEMFVIPLGLQSHSPCCPSQLSPFRTTIRPLWILWSSIILPYLSGEGEWWALLPYSATQWPKGNFDGGCTSLLWLPSHSTTVCRFSLDGCRWGTGSMSPSKGLAHLIILHCSLDLLFFLLWGCSPGKGKWKWKSLSDVRLFATPWTIQSMDFSRPAYWSG